MDRDAARERLRAVRGLVFDLDGTLVLGDRLTHGMRPLPGALEITRWAAERDLPFVIFTNGTVRSPADYARTLRGLGFALPDEAMMTPASSAARVFTREAYKRVMLLGGEGIAGPLWEVGLEVVPPAPGGQPDAVLAGWYPEFTMPALEAACQAVWDGAVLYSCSQTPFFAVENGRALGTSRAISAMIISLTGCRLHVVGKPSLEALRSAAYRPGTALRARHGPGRGTGRRAGHRGTAVFRGDRARHHGDTGAGLPSSARGWQAGSAGRTGGQGRAVAARGRGRLVLTF